MNAWVLLLRGVNVGGNSRLPMESLRTILKTLGVSQAATYIQSGSAVFTGVIDAPAFAGHVAEMILAEHGFRPRALVLNREDFDQAAAGYPWPEDWRAPKDGHIWFLTAPPAPAAEAMTKIASGSERFAFGPQAFYLHAPAGIGHSRLAARAEALLGGPATARNLATVAALSQMLANLKDD